MLKFAVRILAMGVLSSSPVFAEDLKIAVATEAQSMNPHLLVIGSDIQVQRAVYESLIRSDHNHALHPALATEWRITDDQTVWELKLREGVKFHDNSDFTAEDVVYSITRAPGTKENPSTYARVMQGIVGATAVDDYTVHIKTENPDPLMPRTLSTIMIVSNEIGDADTQAFNDGTAAIGTGPYKLVEYRPGDKIQLTANADYWDSAPEWDTVEFVPITNPSSRVSALLAGDVDVIDQVPAAERERLIASEDISVYTVPSSRVVMWVPDLSREDSPFVRANGGGPIENPMRDLRVRQAMSLAIDRESILDDVMQGMAIPTNQLVSAELDGHNPDIEVPRSDPEKARELLAEAGYPDGFELTIHSTNNRYVNDSKQAQAVGQMLSRIGLNVSVETLPVAGYFGKAREKTFSMMLSSWGAQTGESLYIMHTILPTGLINNYGGYSNQKVDALIEEAKQEFDSEKRYELLGEATAIAIDEVAFIPTHFEVNVWATRKGIDMLPRVDGYTMPTSVSLK